MISKWWRKGATLVAMALTLCYCASGGSPPSETTSCPYSGFSGRTLLSGTGLNFGISHAYLPQMIELNGKIYLAWNEYVIADGVEEIQVSVYNGNDSAPAWTRVVGSANGINKVTTRAAFNVKLAALNDKLYATWTEDNGTAEQVRVAVYNGDDSAPAWSMVDGNGVNGLNQSSAQTASDPQIVSFDSKLYLMWSERNGSSVWQIRAKVYGGDDSSPAWTAVDGNGTNGINKNTSRNAQQPSVAVYNSKLYAAWQETNGSNFQARVAVYGGSDSSPTWTFVDGNGVNGLNLSTSQDATRMKLVSNARDLLLFWLESNGAVTPIRARAYGGLDNSPSWTFIDGGGANGLNANTSYSVEDAQPSPFLLGYNILAAWMQAFTGVQSLRLSYYTGTWSLQAGTATNNLNYDSTMDAFTPNTLVTSSCKVYSSWVEIDNGVGNNRVHVGILQ